MEWLEDWINAEEKERVKRGNSFLWASALESSSRYSRPPAFRETDNGFRCVVDLPGP